MAWHAPPLAHELSPLDSAVHERTLDRVQFLFVVRFEIVLVAGIKAVLFLVVRYPIAELVPGAHHLVPVVDPSPNDGVFRVFESLVAFRPGAGS